MTFAVAVFFVTVANADEARPVGDEELAAHAAQITVIVPPEYPAAALRDGIEATVDVHGTVREDGHLAVSQIKAVPDREDFRVAVTDVVHFWLLRPPVSAPPGRVSVIYEAIADDLVYPPESCLAYREGVVVARFELLQNGSVENVRIQQSSGDALMDEEVVRALGALRSRGEPVAWPSTVPKAKPRITVELEVAFTLR